MRKNFNGSEHPPSPRPSSHGRYTSTDKPYIQVENISVSYGKKAVLQDISLQLAAHNVLALIGPSGCGKTSFLNCFNRMADLHPNCRVRGSIRIGNIDVLHPETRLMALRRQVGMVFQKPNPFPISIWKNIALPLKQHGMRSAEDLAITVESTLREVGLWDEVKDDLQRSALALSGGQQQRLCIARALALNPDVILFDEPCSALDPISTQVIENLIKKLKQKLTVIIVTHNLAQARRVADELAVFWLIDGVGRLLETGSTRQIFEAASHPQTRLYLSGSVG